MLFEIGNSLFRKHIRRGSVVDVERNEERNDVFGRHPVVDVVRKPAVHDDFCLSSMITGELFPVDEFIDVRQELLRGKALDVIAHVEETLVLVVCQQTVFHVRDLLNLR